MTEVWWPPQLPYQNHLVQAKGQAQEEHVPRPTESQLVLHAIYFTLILNHSAGLSCPEGIKFARRMVINSRSSRSSPLEELCATNFESGIHRTGRHTSSDLLDVPGENGWHLSQQYEQSLLRLQATGLGNKPSSVDL